MSAGVALAGGRPAIDAAYRPSRSRAVVAGVASQLEPIGLTEVMSVASLQTRTDHKYLLSPEQFTELVDGVRHRMRILQIDSRRSFGYESVYFDTADLALYRAHHQRRRRRYKVRTRTYLDQRESVFEVKLKGYRDRTVKHRFPYEFDYRAVMNPDARSFVDAAVGEEYGFVAPELQPSLTTRYTRATLADPSDAARMTCDIDLVCADDSTSRHGPDAVLVESKSAGGRAVADQVLKSMGIRPVSLSKYCIGTALIHPDLPANKWNRILRHEFDWTPDRPGNTTAQQ